MDHSEPTPASPEAPPLPRDATPPVWPYILPMAGFLVLTSLESYLPTAGAGAASPTWYPLAYTLKVLLVAALFWPSRAILADLRPLPSIGSIALAVVVGLAVALMWVGLDGHYPMIKALGERRAFDPATMTPAPRIAFLAIRLAGLVLLVPLVEELFYRSFLMRWLVDPEYTRVPIGKVTPLGLAVTTGVFGFSHPEWLPAILTGLAWGGLVARTRNVAACVLSHAVANLALGIYVLTTHDWKYW